MIIAFVAFSSGLKPQTFFRYALCARLVYMSWVIAIPNISPLEGVRFSSGINRTATIV